MKKSIIYFSFWACCSSAFGQNMDSLVFYYRNSKLEKALEQSTRLINQYPDKAEVDLMHGRILVDIGQYKEGSFYLTKAISLEKKSSDVRAWALAYLGQAYFMIGDYTNSQESLKKCLTLDATPTVNNYAKRRMFFFGFEMYFNGWKIIETEHLRFHLQMPSEIKDLKDFISEREAVFIEISKELGANLPKKIDFFVWNNAEEPKNKFNLNLGFANPEFVSVYTQINQTKGHEMTHIITHYLGKVLMKTGLINEGTAVYFNQKRDYKLQIVKSYMLKNGIDQINIRDVWDNWEKYNHELSYPLAGAFISKFVNKFGIEGLKKILPNQTYENSKVIFGVKLDELILNFESELKVKQTGLDTTKNDFITLIIKDNHKKGAISLNPIILLDGDQIELEGIQAMKLSKDQVKSISFLKSAAANALFGKIGEQGVIIVSTKAGLINRSFELKDSITEY